MAGLIEKIPFRRPAEPEEIADAHRFFAGDDAGHVTGQVLFVDGGIRVGAKGHSDGDFITDKENLT